MAVKPVNLVEARQRKGQQIPDFVVEAFNMLIAKNLKGKTSVVYQSEVMSLIEDVSLGGRQEIFDNGWLNVERLFEDVGWYVEYDRPAYNETFDAQFTFTWRDT